MQRIGTIITIILAAGIVFLVYQYYINTPAGKGYVPVIGNVQSMVLSSPDFQNGGQIPVKYTCDGPDVNPSLNFSTVSVFAKSLVLTVEDPDSNNFTHWVIFNINPASNGIEENSEPQTDGIEGINDFGSVGYGGPCPQSGTHHYVFKLYSLKTILKLKRGATKQQVLNAIQGNIIEETQLLGMYKR